MNIGTMNWTDLIRSNPEFFFPKDIMDLLGWMGMVSVEAITDLDEASVDRIRVPFWWLKCHVDCYGPPGQAQPFYSSLCTGPDIFLLPPGAKNQILKLRKYFLDLQSPQNPKKRTNRKTKASGAIKPEAPIGSDVPWFTPTMKQEPQVTSSWSVQEIPTNHNPSWPSPMMKPEAPGHGSPWSSPLIKQEIPNGHEGWHSHMAKQEVPTSNSGTWSPHSIKQELDDKRGKMPGYQNVHDPPAWSPNPFGFVRHPPEE